MKRYSEKSLHPKASDLNHQFYGEGAEYYKLGKFKKARNKFKEALEYWPLDPQAWFALGDCYDELSQPSRAEECFRKALKYTAPDELADVYFNLGNSLYDQGKFTDAIQYYEEIDGQAKVFRSAQINLELARNEINT